MLQELKGGVKTRSAEHVARKLTELGNGRVLQAQLVILESEVANILPPEYYLAVGLRESGMRNLNNPIDSDKGWLQISEAYHLPWLRSQPGCPEDDALGPINPASWRAVPGKTASMDNFCPRFSPAIDYALHNITMVGLRVAKLRKIPKSQQLHFATTFYNTGEAAALKGFKEGDIDKYSTGRDYGRWVLAHVKIISEWINAHPNWKA